MGLRNVSHLLVLAVGLAACELSAAQAKTVSLSGKPGSYTLLREGRPYVIKGAGGTGELALLSKLGGNSIRTWGADDARHVLDEAQRHGVTVTIGIWLGHSTGFDYHDRKAVKAQYEMCRDIVTKFRNHPALLAWSFGNEMEGNGEDPEVWRAIEDIAKMSKALDPHHPTMTVLAELGGNKLKHLHRYCPSIDIVGVNSYGGAPTLGDRYKREGGVKPFVVTEFGPPGPWESAKTSWEAPLELSSTQKSGHYRKAYKQTVEKHKGLCLGSYAFLWGSKQEATATWFGMLLPDGRRLASVDTMSELWTGKRVKTPVPTIRSLKVTQSENLKPGELVEARLETGALKPGTAVKWVLTAEAKVRYAAGRDEPVPEGFADAIVRADTHGATVKMPGARGGYRLFAYLLNKTGGAAVANVPLYVDARATKSLAQTPALPFVIVGDQVSSPVFEPTGWMGNTAALTLDFASNVRPHRGLTCLEVTFTGQSSWAGVAWQYPPNDWGDQPEAFDLTGARQLSFWVRGALGDEKVKIEFGLLKKDKTYFDSASKEVRLVLTQEWRNVSLDLKGLDLSNIKTGFVVTVEGQGAPVKFYLDDVEFRERP